MRWLHFSAWFGAAVAGGCHARSSVEQRTSPPLHAGMTSALRDVATEGLEVDAAAVDVDAPGHQPSDHPTSPAIQSAKLTQIPFVFRPARGPASAYATPEVEDQPRLVLMPGVTAGQRYAVVVGLHGQPQRGMRPRDYDFASNVLGEAERLVRRGDVKPFIFALPVFRFEGQNWPGFDLREFRQALEALLSARGLRSDDYYVFGHSGAAGCGGEGLNGAVRLNPRAVAFVDTCIGRGFADAVGELDRASIETWILHSVETAGFRPRQPTEYRNDFDFGRVYRPLGLRPIACPADRPDVPLREQTYRCASGGVSSRIHAFVIDTGAGEAAHQAALVVGTRFFLRRVLGGQARVGIEGVGTEPAEDSRSPSRP